MFDEDENGLVGYCEMTEGLRKLSLKGCAPMFLSIDDFQALALSSAATRVALLQRTPVRTPSSYSKSCKRVGPSRDSAAAESKETRSRAHAAQEDVESEESREMSESPVDRADKDVELTFKGEQFDEIIREQVCVFVSWALWHLCLRCVVAAVHLVEWKRCVRGLAIRSDGQGN